MAGSFLNSDAFWGAVIGAFGSIAGGYFASRYQTSRQLKLEENRQKQRIIESAAIVHGDVITLVKAMLFYRRRDGLVGFYFDYSADYSSRIDMLSDRLGSDKTYLLRRIYGHLVHMQQSTMVPTINSTKIKLLVSPNYEAACNLLYGSTNKFITYTGHLEEALREENYSHLTNSMKHDVLDLLTKLDEIRREHI